MTTDSEAWDRFVAILRRNEQHLTADAAAQVAGWLRERQKRGDFEASQGADAEERARYAISRAARAEEERDNALVRLAAMERGGDDARTGLDAQTQRAYAAERERDEAREALLKTERLHVERCQDALEQRARAEAAERAAESHKRSAESRADAANVSNQRYDRAVKAESLLKEALGLLDGVSRLTAEASFGAIQRMLHKAKAQGHTPDGETP